MAQNLDINSIDQNIGENTDFIQLKSDSDGNINLPAGNFIGDADLSRDGQDLVLEFSEDDSFIVENYFLAQDDFMIQDSSGSVLTSGLVNSFVHSSPEYAQNNSMNDESPVGAVEELKGNATVTHLDGSSDNITLGTPIYEGDVIQTSGDGAVNIIFSDETSMAISEDARVAIDNYKFDASTESGETNLSVLRGVFVYTSGLIGRDDPDDVEINTPVGSIGIRGTIIAGHINPEGQSEISVLEGAIVIKNGSGERTLSQQYETVKLSSFQEAIEYQGVGAANDISKTYGSVSDVLPKLFSSINDAVKEEVNLQEAEEEAQEEIEAAEEQAEAEEAQEEQNTEEPEIAPDPTLEIIQDDVGFGVGGEVLADPIITNDPAAAPKPPPGPGPQNTLQQNGGPEEILYQEPKDFNEPQVIQNFKPIFEQMKAGEVVGTIVLKNYPAGFSIEFNGGGTVNGDFQITHIAGTDRYEISLTGNVVGAVGSTLVPINIDLKFPDSTTVPLVNQTPTILDAAVSLNSPSGYNYDVINVGNSIQPLKIGDFNGDGNKDFASIHTATGDLHIEDFPGASIYSDNTVDYSSIAGVGDVNNDGFADVIVGSALSSGTNGDAFLIEGGGAPTLVNVGLAGNTGDEEGSSVAGIGDFDGDGKSDFAIGSPGFAASLANDGQAILHLSAAGAKDIDGQFANQHFGGKVAGIGDIDGDGYSDILLGNRSGSSNPNEAYIAYGNAGGTAPTDTSGMIKITAANEIVAGSAAGDINGDGYDDFAISMNDGTDIDTYVVYGKAANFGVTEIDMTYLENPDHALKIHDDGVGGATDYNVVSVGDVDGDGFDDLQVGVVGGNQYIVFGDIGGDNIPYVVDGTATDSAGTVGDPDGNVRASADNQSLVGDVNFNDNDNNNLSMKGGGSNNIFEVTDNQFRNIDGGDGFDTIKFMGSGTLDFSNKNFEDISQIEEIKFGGPGQSITLTTENLFNMLKSSDNGELRITGEGMILFDSVNPGAGLGQTDDPIEFLEEGGVGTASYTGTTTLDGTDYFSYNVGGYDLYIGADVGAPTNMTFV